MISYSLNVEIDELPDIQVSEYEKWSKVIRILVAGKRPPAPLQKALITLTRYSKRRPDAINLAGSFDSIIFGLCEAGVLSRDFFGRYSLPSYKWEPAPPREGKIKIEIKEI